MTRPSPPPDIRPARSVAELLAASALFDAPVHPSHALDLLEREGHHLFLAYATGEPVGFVSDMETTHSGKGSEMLLHERGVAPARGSSGEGDGARGRRQSVSGRPSTRSSGHCLCHLSAFASYTSRGASTGLGRRTRVKMPARPCGA